MSSGASAGGGGGGGAPSFGSVRSKPQPVIKPLLNQLESSIQGQFRRMDRHQTQLQTKLAQNVSNMHSKIWKSVQSREAADDLSNWQTKEDLRSYLTAMSLLGSSKNGGGRTFNKEKHNFFDNISHFKETLDAARQKKKDSFHSKLKRLGLKPHTKQAAYLWQQMNERHDGNEPVHTPGPPPLAATLPDVGTTEEKEGGGGGTDGDAQGDDGGASGSGMSPEEEEALRVAAREDDEANAQAAAATVDSAAMAHLALQRLNTTSGPHGRVHPASLGAHDASSTTPYGVPIPGRKGGDPIIAPRVFRKSEWEIEEEAEERAEAAAAEAARRAAEEQRKKEQAERDAKKNKADAEAAQSQGQGQAPGQGQGRGRLAVSAERERVSFATGASGDSSGDNSHRNSRVGSASATPHISRRGSLIGAASALKIFNGSPAKRALQILPDRQMVASANLAASQAHPMSDEMFAAEASRVMGLVLANPMIAAVAPMGHAAAPDSDRFGSMAAAAAVAGASPSSASASLLSARDLASSRPMSGPLGRRALAAASSQQEEIERWNARTPDSARSLAGGGGGDQHQQVANLAHKSILSLAAEKLGVHSMESIGGNGSGTDTPAFRPSLTPASITAAYRSSFELRTAAASASAATPFAASRSSPRPASANANMTPRSSRRATNFGHSATSATTNLHSLNSSIEFREPRARKELVSLGKVLDPAVVFSSIDTSMGSTLMSFEQLHVANRALADEARKRTEQAQLDKAAHEEVVQRKAQKQAEEPDPIDVMRDKLADKSRTRTRTRRDGSPSKTLHTSSSTGHLSSRAASRLEVASPAHAAPSALTSPSSRAAGARRSESGNIAPAGASVSFATPSPAHRRGTSSGAGAHLSSPGPLGFSSSSSRTGLVPGKAAGRDYVSLSPLLIVPKWDDVARPLDYAALVPGYVKPLPQAQTDAIDDQPDKEQQQQQQQQAPLVDADGFPVTPVAPSPHAVVAPPPPLPATPSAAAGVSAAASPTSALGAASSTFSPTASSSSDSGAGAAVRSRRAQLDALFNAQLDEENFEGSASARKKELRRRRRLASIPSPIKPGPSVFQLQKAATLKKSYVKFVAATKDPHQIAGAVSAQQVESMSGRKNNKHAYLQSITQPIFAPQPAAAAAPTTPVQTAAMANSAATPDTTATSLSRPASSLRFSE